MNKLIELFAKKGVFADLMTIGIIFIGVITAYNIQKEAFPNVDYDIISVGTNYPGASPDEVEKLVTNPIERALKEVDGIKKLESVSIEGRSSIIVWLDPNQTTEEEAKIDIQDSIDAITNLPEDADDSIITAASSKNTPVIQLDVASNGLDPFELRKTAKDLKRKLEKLPGVARITEIGVQDIEIRVEADLDKLTQYRISLDELIRALHGQNISIPGGRIDKLTEDSTYKEVIIRTIGEFSNAEDVSKTVIRANDLGDTVRIEDVAKVSNALQDPSIISRTDLKDSISLTVIKKQKADAIEVVSALNKLIDEIQPNLSDKVTLSVSNDRSYFIKRRLKILTNNLYFGLGLILIILTLVLPFRVALLVAVGIPFAFFGTIFFFNMMDISLNLLTLIGLIIVVGMLVDDAIVVTENAVRLMEEGLSPKEAAIKGTQQVWLPVLASVLTTVFAFGALMFMSGIFGKFVRWIPLGVILALMMSLIECYFVLPHHIHRWIRVEKPNDANKNKRKPAISRFLSFTRNFWDDTVAPRYVVLLKLILRRRYLVILGTGVLFVGTVTALFNGYPRFKLFPQDAVEILVVNAEAPLGTRIEDTAEMLKPIELSAMKLNKEELEHVVTKVGIQQLEPNDPNSRRGSEYGQVIIFLTPEPDRDRTAIEIEQFLKDTVSKPPGLKKLIFSRVNPGPPVGKPISVGLRAKKYEDILPAVNKIKSLLAEQPGVTDIKDSYTLGKEEIRVIVNKVEAAAAGLTASSIGTTVRAAYEGVVATTIQELDEEIDVRVSLPDTQKKELQNLSRLVVPNSMGNLIPLSRVATFEKTQGVSFLEHEGNERQVRVTGEIDESKNTSLAVNNLIREKIPELKKEFPEVDYHFGGEDADTQESLDTLKTAFLLAAFAIAMVLVLTFGNLIQPILVMLTIPLGFMAVVWTFVLHNKDLSFMAMFGVIALAGVVVNNAIVYVVFANELRQSGVGKIDSIVEAGRLRLRPIFLTSLTTSLGILPTAYGIGGLDKFVVPIALALGWGMAFGAILTVIVFPACLAASDDLAQLIRKTFLAEFLLGDAYSDANSDLNS